MTRFHYACRLANGVEQDDLYGSDVRPQFCTMCAALADAVDAVISTAPPLNQKQFAVRKFLHILSCAQPTHPACSTAKT